MEEDGSIHRLSELANGRKFEININDINDIGIYVVVWWGKIGPNP